MRKLLSLVVACMMLVSCFAITASADATVFTFTASAPDADGIFGVTFTSPVALKLASATLQYPADKMIVVDAGSKEAVAVGDYFTVDVTSLHDTDKSKLIAEGVVNPYTTATSNDGLTDACAMWTMYFQLVDGAVIEECPFTLAGTDVYSKGYGGINCTGEKSTVTYRVSKATAAAEFDWEALKSEDPIPEPDFTGAVAGTTITCAGKLTAEQMADVYGVEFTAESTVEGARAQKYYGAKSGDIVADDPEAGTTREFIFGEWDGTFEIILENVSAGAKEFKFFVGDAYVSDAIVLNVAE